MIVQIRGTSGSGKTWVMQDLLDGGPWVPEFIDYWGEKKRKKPLYYFGMDWEPEIDVAICGHYESACGGCDNIGSAAAVYELYQKLDKFDVILSEGLLLSEDVKWTSQLNDVKIIFLNTGVERCIEQIKSRRKAAGNDKPLNENNTRNRVAVIERAYAKLRDVEGITCRRASARQAPNIIRGWIDAERTRLDRTSGRRRKQRGG